MPDPTPWSRIGRATLSTGLIGAFGLLCGLPYWAWLDHPSLYHDDFMRVWSLRHATIGEALFRPFNEHMAPLFELVSYLAWRAAGRQIQAIPTTFLIASFAALAATVTMLGAVIWRETRSRSACLVAVAVFSLSSVSAETVLWYSASSFQWAAAVTLAGWFAAASAVGATSRSGRRWWLVTSAFAALAAPAFSAIGILAAPLAGLRLLVADKRDTPAWRHLLRATVPASGLVLYLLICASFRYRQVLTDSLSKNLDLGAAVWATLRAPSLVLFPSLIGLSNQARDVSGNLAAGATLAVLVGCLAWATRSRHRPLLLGGTSLIVGGYLLTYAARAHPGDLWLFEISRYHLFPQVGMVCLVVALLSPILRRFDRGWAGGLFAATVVAALLAGLQYRGMKLAGESSFRFPEQPRLLSAAVTLEGVVEREGIPLDQLFRTIEPIQPRWAPHPWPFHPVLFLLPPGRSHGRLTDPEARAVILSALSPADREAIFGSMEATRYRQAEPSLDVSGSTSTARLVATSRVRLVGEGQFDAPGGLSYLEYQVDPAADLARSLCLPGLKADWPIEVWWADEGEPWSADRSVRWTPDPRATPGEWAIPIDALPHWQRGTVRRLRIVAVEKGRVVVGSPRFLR